MSAVLQPAVAQQAVRLRLPALAVLCTTLLVLCGLYFDTARSIVAIWNSSETFAHGYIILPICLWLTWRQRDVLAALPQRPFWPGLVLLAGCGAAWLLAELADVQVVRQYAFVAMLPLSVLTIFGLLVARALAFPLAYLLLAVPFGEIFIAPLIELTADFTVWALQLTGIPVWRDGTNFSIPSGNWSVVEACSGVRYLIASFTLGTLYAYLTYRSTRRRLLFVLVAILVPVAANALRAYLIVMIGHLSNNKLAAGVDHLIYGWLFFGLVMFLMFWVGSYWREDDVERDEDERLRSARAVQTATSRIGMLAGAALAVVLCAAAWPALATYQRRPGPAVPEGALSQFRSTWQPAAPFAQWTPRFAAPSAAFSQAYAEGGNEAALHILYYRDRPRGMGLINSENRLLADKDPLWIKGPSTTRNEEVGDRTVVLRETILRSRGRAILVWQCYWIGGEFLLNDYAGKLLQARSRLLHGSDDGAAIFASTPLEENPEQARAVLRRFLAGQLPALQATLSAIHP